MAAPPPPTPHVSRLSAAQGAQAGPKLSQPWAADGFPGPVAANQVSRVSDPPTPPAFTIGALAALDAAGSTLTAGSGGSALTAATAAQGALTAGTQKTGGPG